MKAKRYRKLAYAELNKLFKGSGKGYCLKNVWNASPDWSVHKSYQDAWNTMRNCFVGMPYNKGIDVPQK